MSLQMQPLSSGIRRLLVVPDDHDIGVAELHPAIVINIIVGLTFIIYIGSGIAGKPES